MNNDEDYDVIYKIILVGESGVGKSNILTRYIKDEFKSDSKSTVGVEFGSKKVTINSTKVKAQIWDTAGQERYRSITSTYYKGSKGAFIVYDITEQTSFEAIDRWYNEMRNYSDSNISIVLVGNKCDLEERRTIKQEEGQSKAKALGIPFFETSALANIQIEFAFNSLIEDIILGNENNKNNNNDNGEMLEEEFDFVRNSVNKDNGVMINTNGNSNSEGKKSSCC